MKYTEKKFSVGIYKPDASKTCERCVFGRGQHAAWCGAPIVIDPTMPQSRIDVIDKNGRRPAMVNVGLIDNGLFF